MEDHRESPTPTNKFSKDDPIPILFLTKMYDETVYDVLIDLVEYLIKDNRIQYYFIDDKPLSSVAKEFPKLKLSVFDQNDPEMEKIIRYIVSIGGDGTVLFSGKLFQHRATPKIAAIEKGTLGFLCKLKIKTLGTIAAAILEDAGMEGQNSPQINIQKKMRLRCEKFSKNQPPFVFHCLNQVAITKADSETMLTLQIYLQNELFTATSGDGLLVSTPTGSTAYALSAGGPIIHNEIRTTLIQPICPNSLSFRSICIPSNIEVMIKVSKNSNTIGFVSFDGQVSKFLDKGQSIVINQSNYDVNLISFQEDNQLSIWTSKLKSLLKFNKAFKNTISEKFSIALKQHQTK